MLPENNYYYLFKNENDCFVIRPGRLNASHMFVSVSGSLALIFNNVRH